MEAAGIYLHVPFCGKKCPYCDFYSGAASQTKMDAYTEAMLSRLEAYRGQEIEADTVYFGGGTPNLLGGARISRLLTGVQAVFSLSPDAEVTIEANPATVTKGFLQQVREAGGNRLSLGMQSMHPKELQRLGRRHTPEQTAQAIAWAREAGFAQISLDLMVGIPEQSWESLSASIDACAALGADHVSAYLLKIEPGTEFDRQKENLPLPAEDTVCDWYLQMVDRLQRLGFAQYEISNFAKPGKASRHNLKYWKGAPYLGFGPAAHSFWKGRRFFQAPSLEGFLQGESPTADGTGGDPQEVLMLRLRLTEGVSDADWQAQFGVPLPRQMLAIAHRYAAAGLLTVSEGGTIALTPRGFLVSNSLIAALEEGLV